MKQCIDIPRGWQRVVKSQNVIYISPSHDELKSKDDILQYLTSPGTCKCGLQCPLHLDSLFSFDVAIKSKDAFANQNNKYNKSAPNNQLINDAAKGPPVSHSCNLKSSKPSKNETVKSNSAPSKKIPVQSLSNEQNKPPNVRSGLTSPVSPRDPSPIQKLPPISVFCQVNKPTVQQILHLLYNSLENSTRKWRESIRQMHYSNQMAPPNHIAGNIIHRPENPPVPKQHPDSVSSQPKFDRTQSPNVNVVHLKNNSGSKTPSSKSPVTSVPHDQKVPLPKEPLKSAEPPASLADPSKLPVNRQQKRPGTMLQIVQSDPSRPVPSHNVVYPPPQYIQTPIRSPIPNSMGKFPVGYYAVNNQMHPQHIYNRGMVRMPYPPHYYNPNMIQRPPPEIPPEEKKTKSKSKSKSKPASKNPKQPSIVIQPDHVKFSKDGTTRPTLLVSIGDSNDKRQDKNKKSCATPSSSDANLTSVDSILKTCSNPNLTNFPDIDKESESKSTRPPTSTKPPNNTSTSVNAPVSSSSAQYTNSMIPVQYLTPGALVYGVPLIQAGSKPNTNRPPKEQHSNTKSTEKWEGVLSPSEVDAKVQQILSSPQKEEHVPEKEGSPKKRKRQQSAPHMFDRYPGNPALRFQTGHTVKAPKLSKSDSPGSAMMGPQPGPHPGPHPVQGMTPHHPHWAQYPIPHNYPIFQNVPQPVHSPGVPTTESKGEEKKTH